MMKQQRFEGDGAARLIQLIRHHGYNKDVDIELATVTAAPPNIKIKLDNTKLELGKGDLIVAESLLDHERVYSVEGGTVNGSVSDGGTLQSLTVTNGKLTIQSPLKVGDRVIVASIKDGQLYVVLDKAVMI
jgi:hypothetical protein